MDVFKGKASLAELDNLHNVVAKVISTELKRQYDIVSNTEDDQMAELLPNGLDTKLLAQAITFLKNNGVTADVIESNELSSISKSIKEIAQGDNKFKEISVDDMINIAEGD